MVKRSKELDDNLPNTHDRKDALVIARLIKMDASVIHVSQKTWRLNFIDAQRHGKVRHHKLRRDPLCIA